MSDNSISISSLESSDAALFDAVRLPRWFVPSALRPVADVNRRMLTLMKAQPPVFFLNEEIAVALRALPEQALNHLALGPCLLVDAGFHDERRWRAARASGAEPTPADPRHDRSQSVISLARATFFVAWHFARTYIDAVDLVVGTNPASAQVLRDLTVEDLEHLAVVHSDWIQPRWADCPACWQQLLTAGQTNIGPVSSELRGLQLMLGQRWRDDAVRATCAVGSAPVADRRLSRKTAQTT